MIMWVNLMYFSIKPSSESKKYTEKGLMLIFVIFFFLIVIVNKEIILSAKRREERSLTGFVKFVFQFLSS